MNSSNGQQSDGPLDTSFNSTGMATVAFGERDIANAVAIQADGKIVVAGQTTSRDNTVVALARYNPNGRLDATFGIVGQITARSGMDPAGNVPAKVVAIQADGKIVIGGGSFSLERKRPEFTLVGYNPDGSLDASFGVSGMAPNSISFDCTGLVIQQDGKLVVVGLETGVKGKSQAFTVLRFTPNGSLDSTFGKSGKVSTSFTRVNSLGEHASGIAIQTDGKIVVVGTGHMSLSRGMDMILARYNTDGSLDSSFGSDGKVASDTGGDEYARAVAIQADGKIVVAGHIEENTARNIYRSIALIRYNPNGSVDPTFAAGGMVATSYTNSNYGNRAEAIAIQPNGKIVVVAGGFNFSVLKYTPDGHLDASFGAGGEAIVQKDGIHVGNGHAVAIQGDGKIVAVGSRADGSRRNDVFSVVRYLP